MKFHKILVANRSEIAVRIIRACRALEISPVAVYCDGEENAMHVRMADEAYGLGPPLAGFLNPKLLARLAKESGCQAIHPGYGFLSEQAAFAQACRAAGIVFIGPSTQTLRLAGSKTEARSRMKAAGIPTAPGSSSIVRGLSEAKKIATRLGFPVLLKAACGGGGKGMQIARSTRDVEELFPIACEESLRSFGAAGIFLEKYIENAQHIEVQILCDHHGNRVHLGERNCSFQRRHQKLLEEAPSPRLATATREKLIGYAMKATRTLGYTNAGTVEFLVDGQDHIYFLEVNARIQVEHPVTEMITGIDLVAQQICIAAGEPLGFSQKDVAFSGHAIECRIYAEDPFCHFLPSTGKVDALFLPSGPGVRVDTALGVGADITTHYDALLAKIITHGKDRTDAIARMRAALNEFCISPVRTTVPLFLRLLRDPSFLRGKISTQHLERLDLATVSSQAVKLGLVLAACLERQGAAAICAPEETRVPLPVRRRCTLSPWAP